MLFGVLALMSFQLVDSIFISRLGVIPLATQGFTMPLQMLIIGIQVGLGIATTALISRALGSKNQNLATELATIILCFGTLLIAAFATLLWFLRAPILSALGAQSAVFPVVDVYWPWWLLSSWVGAIFYFFNSICRANGNTKLPGAMMVVTSLLNMVLDPIFIFTLGLGIQGAAIASLLAFVLATLIMAPKIIGQGWLNSHWRQFEWRNQLKNIQVMMAPAMLSQLLPPVSALFATKMVASFGAATVAAWALGSRIEIFSIVTVLALTMAMPPMIGNLMGQRQFVQIEQLFRLSCRFIVLWQSAIALILLFARPWLSPVMAPEQAVQSVLNIHLLWVPISLGPLGVCMIMVSSANALGQPMRALLISAMRLFLCYLPFVGVGVLLAKSQESLAYIFIGVLLGNLCAGLCGWWQGQQALAKTKRCYEKCPAV
ncbi:hypothetical protein VST7929_03092 [Vibrio stylophorae]|uniref:Multidrug resistance protein NorM n=2 Tax=Vibrio stylophorae TaxID=659351 RepID=A0ABN8DXR1_9VIBR|nr:hypothetical protein VST7929_03092 [Vibrio stylophorae]